MCAKKLQKDRIGIGDVQNYLRVYRDLLDVIIVDMEPRTLGGDQTVRRLRDISRQSK